MKNNLKIKEIAMSTHYGNEISHLRSIPYGLNIVRSTLISRFQKYNLAKTIGWDFQKKTQTALRAKHAKK